MTENKIQVFANKEFGQLEVVIIGDKVYFPATECAEILGYSTPRHAISRHCKGGVKRAVGVQTGVKADGKPAMQTIEKIFIPEGDLYRLIIRSKLPAAEQFERWVFDEVLPCIRKHGGYITEQLLEQLADCEAERDTFITALAKEQKRHLKTVKDFNKAIKSVKAGIAELKEENEILETCVEAILPKAEYCDIILQCENSIPVSIIAKDYGMTAIKFNRLLHKVGIQYKLSGTWLLYKKYDGCGFTETNTYRTDNGKAVVHTRWTQSGRRLIYDVLMSCGIFPDCEKYGEGGLC